MKKLLILGAGGHGRVMAEAAEAAAIWQEIAFLDDRHAVLNGSLRWPVPAGIREARRFASAYADATVAVGDSAMRLAWIDMLAAEGFVFLRWYTRPPGSARRHPSERVRGDGRCRAAGRQPAGARLYRQYRGEYRP